MKDKTGQVREDVEDINASLKNVLEKLREPRKLLCDILLSATLAIMIGTLIWAVRFYLSMNIDDV